MCDKTFILTDKVEFVPDEEMEKELWFNINASADAIIRFINENT